MKVKVRKKSDPADADQEKLASPETQCGPTKGSAAVLLQPLKEQQTAAWMLAELKKRGSEPQKFLQALCTLVLLRWGEWLRAEERAIAEFEGTTAPKQWSDQLTWELIDSDVELYAPHLASGVWPRLAARRDLRPAVLHELPRLFDPNTIDGWTWHIAATVVGSYSLESLQNPHTAAEFERLLQAIGGLETSEFTTPLAVGTMRIFRGQCV